ncbi:MAG: cobalt ECF transporter T component CbiQ [Deltaproteobacteria bacterium]|nr:cobalt ECF transporter T component CbiQ [Deltaproteobacteria bacterium]
MHHSYIDHLAHRPGILQSLDPRGKVAATIGYVVAVSLTPNGAVLRLGLLLTLLLGVCIASSVPLAYAAKRGLLVLPFAGPVALAMPLAQPGPIWTTIGPLELSRPGSILAATIITKAFLAATALLVLAATTRFNHLLAALRWYRLPDIFLSILAFLYRYLFIVVDEGQRVARAGRTRSPGRYRRPVTTAAAMIVGLVRRSFDRAQRVYTAMLARGYDGTTRSDHAQPRGAHNLVVSLTFGVIALSFALSPYPVILRWTL